MKILCLSDQEDLGLWDYYTPEKLKGIDLIVSCGDLDPAYLEFLTTMSNLPLLYVRGNHDTKYDQKPPLGCIDIDDQVYNFKGLRILGLGGSMRYGNRADMYSEAEMAKRIRRLKGTFSFTNGFDILLSHAPAENYGDQEDLPHHGFACFNALLDAYQPKYMLYGHVHQNYGDFQRVRNHPCGAQVINCCGKYVLDVPDTAYPERGNTGSFFYDWAIRHQK
jgi:predicted phosphodiesterase